MKTNIHHLNTIFNTVKKSNDIKVTFWYVATTGTFFIHKIMRLLNY